MLSSNINYYGENTTKKIMKTIILIHGLHMHSFHFFFMKKELKKDSNLDVRSFDYSSMLVNDKVLDKLNNLVKEVPIGNDIVIVGHSLGGLISRLYLNRFKPTRNIKLITLGTPHRGSLIAKRLNNTIFRPLLGRATKVGLIKCIPAWDASYPLVSIAGIKKVGVVNLFAKDIDEASDGTVFLSETQVDNAKEHVILEDIHHSQLIFHPRAIEEVKKWL